MQSNVPILKLGEVLTHRGEFITVDDLQTYKRVTAQLHAKGIILRDEVDGALLKTKKQRVCKGGDFIVAEIDAKLGGFGIVPSDLEGSIVSSHYFLFEINTTKLSREYLDFFIRTEEFQKQITARGSTNYAAIRPPDVLQLKIPIPPLKEQEYIVATLELLMAKIEEARKERTRAIEEKEKICYTFLAKKIENIGNFSLIEDVCEVKGGVQKCQERIPTNNPRRYITVAHVQRNLIDISDPRFLETTDQEFERWKLLPGDVLVIEGNGSADQIGRTALFRGEIKDCIHQNHVIRIRPNQKFVDPEYLNVYLNSSLGQQQMKEISRTTSGLFNLSVGRIKALKIPVPPLPEQHRIVVRLERLQAKVDAVKRLQMETEREMVALIPAVLAKAFGGSM
jgi:type I restriction enzyme S subunit